MNNEQRNRISRWWCVAPALAIVAGLVLFVFMTLQVAQDVQNEFDEKYQFIFVPGEVEVRCSPPGAWTLYAPAHIAPVYPDESGRVRVTDSITLSILNKADMSILRVAPLGYTETLSLGKGEYRAIGKFFVPESGDIIFSAPSQNTDFHSAVMLGPSGVFWQLFYKIMKSVLWLMIIAGGCLLSGIVGFVVIAVKRSKH